jgi:hypothetical protein
LEGDAIRYGLTLLWFAIGFALSLFFALSAYPHGGGLDGYGCHHNRKAGGYHCHRGPFAGQAFDSKEQMLQKIKGADGAKKHQAERK